MRVLHRLAPAVTLALVLGLIGTGPLPGAADEPEKCRPKPTDADRARIERVRPDRPRLVTDEAGFWDAFGYSENLAAPQRWRGQLRDLADSKVGLPPVTYVKNGGRLQFGEYKNRVVLLAWAWRIEGDVRYLRQARRELRAAAKFPDWNPGHYLDTAEMTSATAIAYDWLHADLSPRLRDRVTEAIAKKGLRTSLCRYAAPSSTFTRRDNWGIVTNAGMALGALAVAEDRPKLAAAVLGAAIQKVRGAFGMFAPDGGWVEGPTYWRYATEHAVKMVASLETALGSAEGLADAAGFAATGSFALHSTAPSRRMANFSNADTKLGRAPQLFWLAQRFGRPVDAWLRKKAVKDKPTVYDLLWFTPDRSSPGNAAQPPATLFSRLHTAFIRSAWGRRAGYVAVKGGSNAASHAHPELGAFIAELRGVRWAVDLGRDSYSLSGYFNRDTRRRYYRLSGRGQNTLLIGGEGQLDSGFASTRVFRTTEDTAETVLDMSSAYDRAQTVQRGVALLDRTSVLIQDEVTSKRRRAVRWFMHTRADVTISADGREATLKRDGKTMTARILLGTDAPARFVAVSAEREPPEATNAGVTRLEIRTETLLRGPDFASLRLAVVLRRPGAVGEPFIRPLAEW